MSGTSAEVVSQKGFYFRDIRFTCKTKSGQKTILRDISSGILKDAEMMAIIGPSGAGKTTLLNILTLQAFGGRAEGEVVLDGRHLTLSKFKASCAICDQEDHLWPFLTAKQTLEYTAQMFLPGSAETRATLVSELLDTLGLTSCADVKCGNPLMKGLSGGQKRRLSVALTIAASACP